MPQSRGRRPRSSNQSIVTSSGKRKPTIAKHKEIHTPRPESRLSRAWRIWQLVWAVVGPFVSLTGFSFLLLPRVSIETGATLDPTHPLSARFKITNTGRTPVYNIKFTCEYGSPLRFGKSGLDMPGTEFAGIAALRSGETATRSCGAQNSDAQTATIRITATYQWPIIRKEDAVSSFFRIVKGQDSYFLLPDQAPPNWAGVLILNGPPN